MLLRTFLLFKMTIEHNSLLQFEVVGKVEIIAEVI